MISRPAELPWVRIGLIAALLIWLGSGIYTVARDELGVVRLFGKPWQTRVPPGMHFAPPWPFARTEVVRTTSAYQMSVGFKIADSVKGKPPTPAETEFLTGDTNIITLEMILQYVIDNPSRLLFGIEDPHFLVRRAAETTATAILAHTPVDVALTTGRAPFLEAVRADTQELLRDYGAGILLVSATLRKIEPPAEVIDAFQDVQNAKSDRERSINEAIGYANETLPRSRGKGEARVSAARAAKISRIEIARGDANRISNMITEYHAAPTGVKSRMYLEVAEEVLGMATIYVIDGGDGRRPMGLKLIE